MSSKKKIGAVIALDGEKEFKQEVAEATNELKRLGSESKYVEEQFKGQENSLEALQKKHTVLSNVLEAHRKKEEALEKALAHANQNQTDIKNGLDEYRKRLEDAKKALEEMQDTASSDEIEKQEQEIQSLNEQIKKGERNYQIASDRITNWETKLNNARAETLRANRALEQNTACMEEAEKTTDELTEEIEEFREEITGAEKETSGWISDLKDGIAEAVAAKGLDILTETINKTTEAMQEMNEASNQLQASIDITKQSSEEYFQVMKDVYANNYGENFEAISEGISKVTQNLGEMNPEKLQKVTESAFALQDTFGMDLEETLRGAQSLIYQFGMDAEEAFDLLGSGAQKGLNYTDELGDNIAEYAGNFAQAGYNAKEYFQLLENGTSNGAYNLDKVNDAINEVTNRLADGTIAGSLENYSEKTKTLFYEWQEGSATQKEVIDAIVADIDNCTNEQEALTMAATAFGTMGEDSNLKFIRSLTSMGDSFDSVSGKMNEIKNIKYDDLNSQITEITRKIQIDLSEQLEKIMPAAEIGLNMISENLTAVESGIAGIGAAIIMYKLLNSKPFESIVKGITQVVASYQAWGAATTAAAVKTAALNAVTNISLWGAIATAVGVAATALTAFALQSEDTAKTSNSAVKETQKAYKELEEQITDSHAARKESTESIESEYAACKVLAKELYSVSEAEKQTEEGKARMSAMVDTLNEKISGLNLQFDETTGALNMEKSALDEAVASMEQYALASAAQDNLKEVASERIALLKQREEALKAYDDLCNEFTANELEYQKAVEAGNEAISQNTYLTGGASVSAEQYATAKGRISDEMLKQQQVIADLNDQLSDNQDEFDTTSEMVTKYTEAAKSSTDAVNDLTEGTERMTAAQREAAAEIEAAYDDMEDSIRDSVKNSVDIFKEFSGGTEISKEEVLANLESQAEGVSNWAENMQQLASRAGSGMTQELYDYLAEMGPESANLVAAFVNMTDEELQRAAETFAQTTEKLPESVAENITEAARQWGTAGTQMAEAAKEGSAEAYEAATKESENAGKENAEKWGEGVASSSNEVTGKVEGIAKDAVSTANGYSNEFKGVGYNMMSGMAIGLNSGSGLVNSKVRQIMQDAVKEANKYNKTNSPSKRWRDEVGRYMSEGAALGIQDGQSKVEKASKDMAKSTVTAAKKELEINSPSGVFRKEVGEQIGEGTALGIKIKKAKSKKAAKEMAQEVAQAAESAIEDYRKNNINKINTTLDDEEYMWKMLVKKAKKGGKAYQKEIKKLAKEHLKEIKQQRKEERLSTQESLLSNYKEYYELSAKAEMQYWDIARKQFKEGTEQRLEADKKYFAAKEEYYSQLSELEEEYYEKCMEINDKLADDIEELEESYKQAFEERKSSIKSAFGTFDEFTSEAASPETLLANMQSQTAGYALWIEQLQELSGKGMLKDAFMEELRQMGPEATATIMSLNMMTEEQLKLAQEAWDEKDRLAEAQAAKETESLRQQKEEEIKVLKETAQAELNTLKEEYTKAYEEINTAIEEPLKKLLKNSMNLGESAVAEMIKGLKGKVKSKETTQDLKGIQEQVAKGLDGLPEAGKNIGKDTLANLLDGLSNKLEIKKGAKSFAKQLEKAIKKELGTDTLQSAIEKSNSNIQNQQTALSDYLAAINGNYGITMLNNLVTQPAQQTTNVTVNNSGVAELVAGLVNEMRGVKEKIQNMKVVLDTGTVAGEIGSELAMQSRRW